MKSKPLRNVVNQDDVTAWIAAFARRYRERPHIEKWWNANFRKWMMQAYPAKPCIAATELNSPWLAIMEGVINAMFTPAQLHRTSKNFWSVDSIARKSTHPIDTSTAEEWVVTALANRAVPLVYIELPTANEEAEWERADAERREAIEREAVARRQRALAARNDEDEELERADDEDEEDEEIDDRATDLPVTLVWRHWADYMMTLPERDIAMTVAQMEAATLAWDKQLERQKLTLSLFDGAEEARSEDIFEAVGLKVYKLTTKSAYVAEGQSMHNCVATYWGRSATEIYSLREPDATRPTVTIEVRRKSIVQLRLFGNARVGKDLELLIKQWGKLVGFTWMSANMGSGDVMEANADNLVARWEDGDEDGYAGEEEEEEEEPEEEEEDEEEEKPKRPKLVDVPTANPIAAALTNMLNRIPMRRQVDAEGAPPVQQPGGLRLNDPQRPAQPRHKWTVGDGGLELLSETELSRATVQRILTFGVSNTTGVAARLKSRSENLKGVLGEEQIASLCVQHFNLTMAQGASVFRMLINYEFITERE